MSGVFVKSFVQRSNVKYSSVVACELYSYSVVHTNTMDGELQRTPNPQKPYMARMYINILLDKVLATDVNKYSLASARCQPIWRTKLANWIYF